MGNKKRVRILFFKKKKIISFYSKKRRKWSHLEERRIYLGSINKHPIIINHREKEKKKRSVLILYTDCLKKNESHTYLFNQYVSY